MTVAIRIKDVLEPVMCDEDFVGAVQALNLSSAKGQTFAVLDAEGGGHVALNIPNINVITEVDE